MYIYYCRFNYQTSFICRVCSTIFSAGWRQADNNSLFLELMSVPADADEDILCVESDALFTTRLFVTLFNFPPLCIVAAAIRASHNINRQTNRTILFINAENIYMKYCQYEVPLLIVLNVAAHFENPSFPSALYTFSRTSPSHFDFLLIGIYIILV